MNSLNQQHGRLGVTRIQLAPWLSLAVFIMSRFVSFLCETLKILHSIHVEASICEIVFVVNRLQWKSKGQMYWVVLKQKC